VLLKAIQT